MTCGFIDDGYTAKGFIKESHGPSTPRSEYRPAPSEETIPHYDGYRELPPKDQLARTSTMLAKDLVKWDLKDSHELIPSCREAATMRRLPHAPALFRLEAIITQVSPSDDDPQEPSEPGNEGYADKTPSGN